MSKKNRRRARSASSSPASKDIPMNEQNPPVTTIENAPARSLLEVIEQAPPREYDASVHGVEPFWLSEADHAAGWQLRILKDVQVTPERLIEAGLEDLVVDGEVDLSRFMTAEGEARIARLMSIDVGPVDVIVEEAIEDEAVEKVVTQEFVNETIDEPTDEGVEVDLTESAKYFTNPDRQKDVQEAILNEIRLFQTSPDFSAFAAAEETIPEPVKPAFTPKVAEVSVNVKHYRDHCAAYLTAMAQGRRQTPESLASGQRHLSALILNAFGLNHVVTQQEQEQMRGIFIDMFYDNYKTTLRPTFSRRGLREYASENRVRASIVRATLNILDAMVEHGPEWLRGARSVDIIKDCEDEAVRASLTSLVNGQ